MSLHESAVKAVRTFFIEKMDKRTQDLRSAALWDLHFGPYGAEYYKDSQEVENWPGYVDAVEALETWSGENITEVWVDIQSMEVLTDTPPDDMLGEDIYHFERKDVRRVVFKELVTDGGMS